MKLMRKTMPYQPMIPSMLEDFFGKEFSGFDAPKVFKTPPAVNISENDENFKIELAVPGLKKEEIKIDIENELLTISYEHKDEKSDANEKFTKREFSYSSFKRSFNVPEEIVDAENIIASYNNGVLNLLIPKKKEVIKPKQTKSISIS